ncbi:unnamed protein product [Durusdinium trenchii]|uniref:Uncharacterized protein n=1 Tax=Durusdinium trenchii TaxID=1381693 RepID=A0ABP0P0D1_9DINO
MVKRHASDDKLGQEPLLAFPHRFLQMMGPIPQEPRPLVPVKPDKREAYMTIAKHILKRVPTESDRRSVKFLIELCTKLSPQPVPPLPWTQEAVSAEGVRIGLPQAVARLCPVIKFSAKLGA